MSEIATLERTESSINKAAIREFAVNARRKLKERVELQANKMGFFADNRPVQYEFEDDKQFKINGEFYSKKQVKDLKDEIESNSFDVVIDKVAYTWFNRFIALYYMELHNYIDNGLNVVSSLDDLNKTALNAPNYLKSINKIELFEAVQNNDNDKVYRILIKAQCNELNSKLPFLFEKIEDYTELLFPTGMLNNDSFVRELLALDKNNWNQVEIIGWLYQYYIAEKKDEVFADLKKGKKISKENVPAATQIFTPKWIVKYMVENSVGKLWLESHQNNDLQSKFKYYLESAEQENDVKQKLNEIINKNIKPEEIKVLDPACGSGHILVTAFEVLYEIYKSAGYLEEEIPEMILKNNLYGLDICDRAAQLAQFAVMMRSREYDKNILNKVIKLNITSIQDTNWIDNRVKEALLNRVENKILATHQVDLLIDTFRDAKEYGSIIDVKDFDFNFWNERLNAIQTLNMGLLYIDVVSELQRKLPQLIKQAFIMQKSYECVVTNPPYMGAGGMGSKLTEYVKRNYKDTKSDMSTVFMEKTLNMTTNKGYVAMINIPVWMFLSSYEKLRENLITNNTLINMLHFGRGVFGSDFGSVAFVFNKYHINNYMGSYRKLFKKQGAVDNVDTKEKWFFEKIGSYIANQNNFLVIPGYPIVYWLSEKFINALSNEKLSNYIDLVEGVHTRDNDQFLRFWHEVSINKSALYNFDAERKWFPYNKGGSFRQWYGNNEYVINWEHNGRDVKSFKKSSIGNSEHYFEEGITLTIVTSARNSFRYSPVGAIYDVSGPTLYAKNNSILKYLLGYLTSKLVFTILRAYNPTISIQIGDIKKLPFVYDEKYSKRIEELVNENIEIAKDDWDSFETSWDFETHPLIRFCKNPNSHKWAVNGENINNAEPITMGDKIENCFNDWDQYKQAKYEKFKQNETEINKLFLDIFGLNDEIDPKVEDDYIALRKADKTREVKSLLSYAVGCMLGRYSLDEKGLAFAGGTFDSSKYKALEVDEDGIIPVLADTWFEDDIIEELKRFLSEAFGAVYLTENLKYIAKVLKPNSNESSESIIRNYFLKDFYKDHLQTYKKRPIYWLFTSGKEKAFNCLVYLHRYDKTTLSRIRKDYLHKFQTKLDVAISQAEDSGNVKLSSLYAKYKKELQHYDENIKDLADAQIELNLDDGVKVNYAKFKGLLEAEKDIVGKEK